MYESSYSASGFWEKLTVLPKKTECSFVKTAITLFVVLTEGDTQPWVKATIVAALGYFIFPLDLIPDFLPCGFTDDIVVMTGVLAELAIFVTPSVQARVIEYMPVDCL